MCIPKKVVAESAASRSTEIVGAQRRMTCAAAMRTTDSGTSAENPRVVHRHSPNSRAAWVWLSPTQRNSIELQNSRRGVTLDNGPEQMGTGDQRRRAHHPGRSIAAMRLPLQPASL